jgi:hypothetical protein
VFSFQFILCSVAALISLAELVVSYQFFKPISAENRSLFWVLKKNSAQQRQMD